MMSTKYPPFLEAVIRYGSYPLVIGVTALVLFGGLAGGWPYVPTVPLTVAAALACVALLERRLPFHAAWAHDHRDSTCDAIHAAVNLVVLLTVHGVVAALTPLWSAGILWPVQWPLWAQALAVGVVLDLSLYGIHRLSHRVAWLWRFHAIHHSSERLYWLNGERRHPLHAGVMAAPGLLALMLMGAPAIAVGAWLGLLAVHLAFQHSNLDYRIGPLRFVIGAAEVHRWHHKREYEDAQVNYGEFWMVWDHLFGTFRLPKHRLGASEVGLKEADFPMDYGTQLVYPFRRQPAAKAVRVEDYGRARAAFLREKELAASREAAGDRLAAWRALELAHIVSQPHLDLHLRSHLAMLGLAWRTYFYSECLAQLIRLTLSPVGHALGRTPPQNVGTGRFGVMERGTWPSELDPVTFQRRWDVWL
jgi:sterol desaturase/sphingolipid hydroxylase (fatty acid hydroxylase superfamily)